MNPAVHRLVLLLTLGAACAATGCYSPKFRDCQLSCDDVTGCPADLSCVAGYCRSADAPAVACLAGGDVDGSLPLDPDAASADAQVLSDGAIVMADASHTVDAAGPSPIDAATPHIDAAAPPDAATCDCDPLGGQSCCGSGRTCDVIGGDPTCREVATAGQQAADCDAANQCAAGYSCVAGTCHELCDADGDCVGGGALCELPVGAWKVCTSFCDALSGSGCESDWACGLQKRPGGTRWVSDCRVEGAGEAGDACTADAQCGSGLTCAGTPKHCASYCNSTQSGGSGCPGTATCQMDADSPVIDGVTWGACL
jgi:hypothetical protein